MSDSSSSSGPGEMVLRKVVPPSSSEEEEEEEEEEEKRQTFSPVIPFATGSQSVFGKPEDQELKHPPVVKPLPENFGLLQEKREKRQNPVSDEGDCATLTPPVIPVGGGSEPPRVGPFGGPYVITLSPEQRLKFFGVVPPPKSEEKATDERQKGLYTVPPPVFNLCLSPLSEEEQRQKGLYTVKREEIPTDTKMFPFARKHNDGTPRMSFTEKPFLLPLTEEERRKVDALCGIQRPPVVKRRTNQPPPLLLYFQQQGMTSKRPEKCVSGEYITPYCKCSQEEHVASGCSHSSKGVIKNLMVLPNGALEEHRPNFIPIWLAYNIQTRQSHYFEVDDHPGSCFGASVVPLPPSVDFNRKDGVPMELATRGIEEYNEKESYVYKYKVLKIEKVNFSAACTSVHYWMTVKVLNLSLANPIETFLIHAGIQINTAEKVIYCCHPKEEETVGFPCCDVCFGKLYT